MRNKQQIAQIVAEHDKAIEERQKLIELLKTEREEIKRILDQNDYGSITNMKNKIKSLIEDTNERISSL